MEDRCYRRLRYDPAVVASPFWPQQPKTPASNSRLRKNMPGMKKKCKENGGKIELFDIPNYLKPYRDKYGSVSAHSTSAIYGALRAPHCHAMYNTSDMWYASVRSLNSRPRDAVYPTEGYDWREAPVYKDGTREGCPVGPHEMLRRPPCACMIRRKPLSSSRLPLRCKYCASVPQLSGALKVPLPSKKIPMISDKMKLNSVTEEKDEIKLEHVDRMSGYKKHITSSAKSRISKYNKEHSSKEVNMTSRKSILECDVTAYDLIKKIPKTTISEDSDDVEDDLSDNAVVKNKPRLKKLNRSKHGSSNFVQNSSPSNAMFSPGKMASSHNDKIYNESSSVLLGGQRIFTRYQSTKTSDSYDRSNGNTCTSSSNGSTCSPRWQKMYIDEEICIPEPDYDCSDDSDDDSLPFTIKNLKLTYSPPLIRKTLDESLGLGVSREISKSMSSLLSQETVIPNISINPSYTSSPSIITEDNDLQGLSIDLDIQQMDDMYTSSDISQEVLNTPTSFTSQFYSSNDAKYETFSSSDCSSNGGTISSDYPTWTSSSSSELKSILKKKRKRENIIQEKEQQAAVKIVSELESKDSQRKKQVQFLAGGNCNSLIQNSETFDLNGPSGQGSANAVICDSENSLENSKSVIDTDEELFETFGKEADLSDACNERDSTFSNEPSFLRNVSCGEVAATSSGILTPLQDCHSAPAYNLSDALIGVPKHKSDSLTFPIRSSSLEDVRDSGRANRRGEKNSFLHLEEEKKNDSRRKRRTTLPKRRFSDLHLHILLCPTRSSLCGDGSSSDDVPLTTPPRSSSSRAHRSLPESPIELQDDSNFCFDFIDRRPKDKVSPSRSKFYVPSQYVAKKCNSDNTLSGNDNAALQESHLSLSIPSNDGSCPQSATDDEQLDIDGAISPVHDDNEENIVENEYETLDPIYEELSDISSTSKRLKSLEAPQKSFFEGASKTDILSYLEDAKERGLTEGLSEDESKVIPEEDEDDDKLALPEDDEKGGIPVILPLVEAEVIIETVEANNVFDTVLKDSSGDDSNKVSRSNSAEVERNDSGVGAETSKPSRISKLATTDNEEQLCADCDHQVEPVEDEISGILYNPLVCRKCDLRRCERKEIIIEFVDTELKYGRDLRIIKEEFYKPMEIAGLLAREQLMTVFLNFEELIIFNIKFSEKLQDALDIAMEHGDEDYTTVNIGKIFLETSSMLHAFETYCVKQAPASVLLSSLEKEKELLRIFLRVSQMENTLLRRMNLPAFLMVPVQRVTRYPLLLSRLHKVTPIHHKDRNALKEAQQKVELHLEHINQQTKGVGGTKIWRRISNISASHRRLGNLQDIGSIKLRKMALEILKWKQDEVKFVMAGKLHFTQIADYPWNKKGRSVKFTQLHALLVALGKPNSNYRPEMAVNENPVLFPRNTGIRDASLVLMKEKNGRFVVIRDPLYLGSCVISCDTDGDEVFEIQEYTTKEAYLLKGENKKDTKEWLRQLRYHAKDLGTWRRRRNALANIMINGMIRP